MTNARESVEMLYGSTYAITVQMSKCGNGLPTMRSCARARQCAARTDARKPSHLHLAAKRQAICLNTLQNYHTLASKAPIQESSFGLQVEVQRRASVERKLVVATSAAATLGKRFVKQLDVG